MGSAHRNSAQCAVFSPAAQRTSQSPGTDRQAAGCDGDRSAARDQSRLDCQQVQGGQSRPYVKGTEYPEEGSRDDEVGLHNRYLPVRGDRRRLSRGPAARTGVIQPAHLGVQVIVTGIDSASHAQLWTETYERPADRVERIAIEVAHFVAHAAVGRAEACPHISSFTHRPPGRHRRARPRARARAACAARAERVVPEPHSARRDRAGARCGSASRRGSPCRSCGR